MKLKDLELSKVSFPKKAERVNYFEAAVIYILTEGKTDFYYSDNNKESMLDSPKIKAIIKSVVPGHNSVLLNLEILSNVNQHIIEDDNLTLNQKIEKISKSIKRYVII